MNETIAPSGQANPETTRVRSSTCRILSSRLDPLRKKEGANLYAIEYLGGGTALIGTKSGNIFVSKDNGETWKDQGVVGHSADDFAWLGGSRVLYTTYTGNRNLYLSEDSGTSWARIGGVGTGQANDWLDHVIYINDGDVRVVVGGTNKG